MAMTEIHAREEYQRLKCVEEHAGDTFEIEEMVARDPKSAKTLLPYIGFLVAFLVGLLALLQYR